MRNRFKNTLYTIEDIKFINGHWQYVRSEDGTLFSGPYRTKIKPEDLPEWYVRGRYHKRFGYMSTKGITDLLYIPNRFSNHYLKDDCLLISYGGKIREVEIPEGGTSFERYEGWDERVWGSEIVGILKGARMHSGYDIAPFIEKLKRKKEWLQKEYPDEFGPERWNIDVDRMFSDDESAVKYQVRVMTSAAKELGPATTPYFYRQYFIECAQELKEKVKSQCKIQLYNVTLVNGSQFNYQNIDLLK